MKYEAGGGVREGSLMIRTALVEATFLVVLEEATKPLHSPEWLSV